MTGTNCVLCLLSCFGDRYEAPSDTSLLMESFGCLETLAAYRHALTFMTRLGFRVLFSCWVDAPELEEVIEAKSAQIKSILTLHQLCSFSPFLLG